MLLAALLVTTPVAAIACSRVFVGPPSHPAVVARTMDWDFSFNDTLLVLPRGQRMDGGLGDVGKSHRWTSRYGSIVASLSTYLKGQISSSTGNPFDVERDGATDGLNEKGLSAHILELTTTRYPEEDDIGVATGVSHLRWARYVLDTCATVREAVSAMEAVSIIGVHGSVKHGVHLAVEDASGDAAIFEVINGSLRLHRGAKVLTNDPPYPDQVENLQRYKGFGGRLGLPGDIDPPGRFVRLSHFSKYVPASATGADMVLRLRGVISSVAVPQGAPDPDDGHPYPTWWTSLSDLEEVTYNFAPAMRPNMLQVDLRKMAREGKLDEGADVMMLDPMDPSLAGEVSSRFAPVQGPTLLVP